MATQTWKYLQNTFYTNTVDSIKTALILTNDHLAKLTANEADAGIAAIKTAYLPEHNTFVAALNQLNSKQGVYRGRTQSFEEMLSQLSQVKINEWRGKVFAVFPEGSADALAIFPRDRQPFQQDTYDQRVENTEALSITLATYTGQPALLTLSTDVHAFYLLLTGSRALQQTGEGSIETLRTNLKEAHHMMCNGLYRNLGTLMAKYFQNPLAVQDYFDLTLLRDTGGAEPLVLEGTVNDGQVVNLSSLAGEIQPSPETVIRLYNESSNGVALVFYSANTPTEQPGPGVQFTLNAGEMLEKTFADFQFDTFNQFNVYQSNGSGLTGNWKVEIDL